MTASTSPKAAIDPAYSVLDRFRLDGKTAVVTGAGGGIGRGSAVALAQAGAKSVVLVGRTESSLVETAISVAATGSDPIPVVCDVTDLDAFAAFAPKWNADILVNNAGTNEPADFLHVSTESFDRIVGLNLKSVYFSTQAIVRTMIARNSPGSIINISSQMGLIGSPRRSVYCATKHAIEGFTKAIAVELAKQTIRVNSIAPTYIRTPMTEPYFEEATFLYEVVQSIPVGRLGTVEEITTAVVYLASEASSLVTGSCLVVDGGWTAQ